MRHVSILVRPMPSFLPVVSAYLRRIWPLASLSTNALLLGRSPLVSSTVQFFNSSAVGVVMLTSSNLGANFGSSMVAGGGVWAVAIAALPSRTHIRASILRNFIA